MPRPIDVSAHYGKSYFRVAKDAVFGNKCFLDPDGPAYSNLQDCLNKNIRNTKGMLQWAPHVPFRTEAYPLLSAEAFRRPFQKYMRLTKAGMHALQTALVEQYQYMRDPISPDQPLRESTPSAARRLTRHCLPVQARART